MVFILYLQVVFVQRWSLKGGVNPLKPSNLPFHHSIPLNPDAPLKVDLVVSFDVFVWTSQFLCSSLVPSPFLRVLSALKTQRKGLGTRPLAKLVSRCPTLREKRVW